MLFKFEISLELHHVNNVLGLRISSVPGLRKFIQLVCNFQIFSAFCPYIYRTGSH
jgi:hypothetical protein